MRNHSLDYLVWEWRSKANASIPCHWWIFGAGWNIVGAIRATMSDKIQLPNRF